MHAVSKGPKHRSQLFKAISTNLGLKFLTISISAFFARRLIAKKSCNKTFIGRGKTPYEKTCYKFF